MLCKVTHCAECVSANTKPHQLCWGDAQWGVNLKLYSMHNFMSSANSAARNLSHAWITKDFDKFTDRGTRDNILIIIYYKGVSSSCAVQDDFEVAESAFRAAILRKIAINVCTRCGSQTSCTSDGPTPAFCCKMIVKGLVLFGCRDLPAQQGITMTVYAL